MAVQFHEGVLALYVQFHEYGTLVPCAMQRGRGFGFMPQQRSTNNNFLAHSPENEYNRDTK